METLIFVTIIGLLSGLIGCFLIGIVFAIWFRKKGIYRARDEKIFGGVCGGIAKSLAKQIKVEDSATFALILRLILIILFFGFGVSLWLYIFLWIFMKKESIKED
ncbi:MAG: PspC domain-containing protein [Candidatus Buchananbacteria bacterium]|nr:PspC domain-containing protein [Candidatus Buchananbacteria bacterium]